MLAVHLHPQIPGLPGTARNRFYPQYVGKAFPSFPRTAYKQHLIEQLLAADTSDFFRGKLRAGLEMHNNPATMANVASQNTLVDAGVGKVLAVFNAPHYQAVIAVLDKRLTGFFHQYSDQQYDLWTGGSAKGSIDRPEIFQSLYGDDWQPAVEIKPAFKE